MVQMCVQACICLFIRGPETNVSLAGRSKPCLALLPSCSDNVIYLFEICGHVPYPLVQWFGMFLAVAGKHRMSMFPSTRQIVGEWNLKQNRPAT